MSLSDGSHIGSNTAYLALLSKDSLDLSQDTSNPKPPVLIWDGSSVVGNFAIQLAKLHGYPVATTCSPRNFDYVKNAGDTYAFDYNDVNVVAKIQKAVPTLSHVFETIVNTSSSATAAAALGGRPEVLCTVRPGKANTEGVPSNVRVNDVLVFRAFPTAHTYRRISSIAELYEQLSNLLQSNSIVPPPVNVLGGPSPQSVMNAMMLNRDGKISAEKLCFEVFSAFEKQHA
ncbi:hypothetical protein CORC01_02973 [Colletotrichum orchidophilum]|uniref:Alcohol dehydrogenase-like C-terminal domain-containing protein n=1 Tax=Colletotrichum orchidophilum TaxID=1209926 RepID=A0A1G4BK13_9PEZI|nr:uncharacterized protein CORC01_02973 [Colletotrichum orchidophilum]OHF01782.1 hypothetical protein CORC01_02973 [Colletotrichum orchidophilum]